MIKALFVLIITFWSCRKSGLVSKIRLISKFLTSKPAQQTIGIHISSNISRSKSNQTMKIRQLKHITWEIFSFKNYAEIEVGRLVPDVLLFFKNA